MARAYGPLAGKKVKETVGEMNKGTLKNGSGAKVTDKRQAVAIGLSKARAAGGKVPKAAKKK